MWSLSSLAWRSFALRSLSFPNPAGGAAVVSPLGATPPTRAQAKKHPGCSAEVRIFYTLAHASSKEGLGMIPAA